MTGSSGRQRVQVDCFNSFVVTVPSDRAAAKFGEIVSPLMRLIKSQSEESQTLSALRDTLLPKLLSGEIRVGEAREMVGE